MLLATTLIVCCLVAGPKLYDWYTSVPLSEAVADFNSVASRHEVGKHEPPITEKEIVTAIESQLTNLAASAHVKDLYERFVRTHRLPRGARLDSISGSGSSSGEDRTVWWINLDVMTGPKSGYAMRIRETMNPVAANAPAESP